jgi:hypothetical protein
LHEVPWATLAWVQVPLAQPSVVQGLPSSQLRHWLPPRPHCAADCVAGETQLVPLRQPLQHVATLPEPRLQTPPGQGLPFGALEDEHAKDVQVSSVHGLPSLQLTHLAPLLPQSFC